MINLDYKDTRPIYEQVVDRMQKLILSGALAPDSKMPSVRSLAMDLSINPNTIQRAYAELERLGFIYTIRGRGNFVLYNEDLATRKKQEICGKIESLMREAQESGIKNEEILSWMREKYGKGMEDSL